MVQLQLLNELYIFPIQMRGPFPELFISHNGMVKRAEKHLHILTNRTKKASAKAPVNERQDVNVQYGIRMENMYEYTINFFI